MVLDALKTSIQGNGEKRKNGETDLPKNGRPAEIKNRTEL
jgi:hypothetical protein